MSCVSVTFFEHDEALVSFSPARQNAFAAYVEDKAFYIPPEDDYA
jgi:hypothetical protein